MSTLIPVAHSPDADDAFMRFANVRGRVMAEELRFTETPAFGRGLGRLVGTYVNEMALDYGERGHHRAELF